MIWQNTESVRRPVCFSDRVHNDSLEAQLLFLMVEIDRATSGRLSIQTAHPNPSTGSYFVPVAQGCPLLGGPVCGQGESL